MKTSRAAAKSIFDIELSHGIVTGPYLLDRQKHVALDRLPYGLVPAVHRRVPLPAAGDVQIIDNK